MLRSVAGFLPPRAKVSAKQPGPGGLIFGLIRLRSYTFIGVRINAVTQVTDVNDIWRTVIPTSENRRVGWFDPVPRDVHGGV